MNKEKLDQLIGRKSQNLDREVQILLPDQIVDPQMAARWMIGLLNRMYFQHGVAKNEVGLVAAIESGICRPWFATKGGEPVACAALIENGDGTVEIGRAVSFERGLGSLLMLKAAFELVAGIEGKLVAEVRVSDSFWGIPSSLPTQVVCFRHLQLQPHAIMPAFGHGNPFRQEMFVMAASVVEHGDGLVLPTDLELSEKIEMARRIVKMPVLRRVESERIIGGWEVQMTEPFAVVGRSKFGVSLESALHEAELRANFCLLSLELSPENFGWVETAISLGFVVCGFDRSLSQKGEPVLMLGKLKSGTTLAPINFVSDIFEEDTMSVLKMINNQFRK